MNDCYYCNKDENSYLIENDYAAGFYDESPSSPGHFLIITKRHTPDFFEMTREEQQAVNDLMTEAKKLIDEKYNPDAYNMGANCGPAAGQSVRHAHFHLIPRYEGDTENPKGGVRNIMKK
ncbi:MAG: HIT family protein [Alkalibacterium sp.]|nr:HIT family protein [Alkalibacterium sp.]